MTNKNAHHLPAWAEIEYTALCKSPYLSTPFFVPKESKVFLCREDGSRKEARILYLVFKPADAPEDAEWEDDPVPGEILVSVLGDDDEEVEPVKAVFLDQDVEDFIQVVEEDDATITFDIDWDYGEVKVEKSEKTRDGFVCKKEDFGDEGLLVTLTPDEGAPFTMRLQIPYLGFSLYDKDDNKVHGDVVVPHDKVNDYSYDFVGDDNNDRFSLHLDNDKLIYTCVLRPHEAKLVVRDQRQKMAIVDELPSEGKLTDLMMNAHEILVKNKNYRWRVTLSGTSLESESESEFELEPTALGNYAYEQFQKAAGNIDELGGHLIALEQKYAFQWFWLKEEDWRHDDAMFDMFMKQLVAFSYVSQKPIQGDQLQARNNKRKIRRCAKMILAHQAGEQSLWDEDEEARKEILYLFSTFHKEFTEALEN
jgi:hypothetical protein